MDALYFQTVPFLVVYFMYSLNVEPQHTRQPAIKRKLCTDLPIQLLPVMVEMCRAEFNMVEPVALYMGDGVYRIFDIYNPSIYVKVRVIGDVN